MKYREAGKKGASSCLYSTLPETLETQHAKEASQLQSQVSVHLSSGQSACSTELNHFTWIQTVPWLCVFLQLTYRQKDVSSLFHLMPETADSGFIRRQMEMLSEVRQLEQ